MKNRSKGLLLGGVVVLLAAVAGLTCLFVSPSQRGNAAGQAASARKGPQRIVDRKNAPPRKQKERKPRVTKEAPGGKAVADRRRTSDSRRMQGVGTNQFDVAQNFPPEEKRLVLQVQQALDDNDFKAMKAAFKAAMKSANAEVRRNAVEAMSQFGAKALPELTGAMSDSDGEVAQAALDAAQSALLDIEDPGVMFSTTVSYLKVFANDEEALTAFSGSLLQSANALTADEEGATALQNRTKVVKTVGEMIEKGGKLGEEAKDWYQSITCTDWIDGKEAERWAQDPDNYEVPESPEAVQVEGGVR